MTGVAGQEVRTILWLMRIGNCWHETLDQGQGLQVASALGIGRKIWPGARESTLGPGLKGLSLLSPPGATFALYYR